MSEVDAEDPGMEICLNILGAALNAIGGELGPIGTFAGGFLSGMINTWSTNAPPTLNATFASLLERLTATSLAVDTQLATISGDVTDNWDLSFTFGGSTVAVSDLATIAFPAKGTDDFQTMANTALFALDQSIWATVLQANFVITLWQEVVDGRVEPFIIASNDPLTPPTAEIEQYIATNPSFYYTYAWHVSEGKCSGDTTGWAITEYSVGTGVTALDANNLSGAACAYLFTDSAFGVIVNTAGLYSRETVFTGLQIRTATWQIQDGGEALPKLSFRYLRAMKEGRTLGLLIAREGREAVEKRIIDQVNIDRVFARKLKSHPRKTLEAFLDVRIPETVKVHVTIEDGRHFGIVIPRQRQG